MSVVQRADIQYIGCTSLIAGLDVIVDTSGCLWLLECNSDPSMAIFEERLQPACGIMLDDTVELVTVYSQLEASAFFG